MAKITIRRDQSAGTISRYIYGNFSEHLGNCIYGGIFVGEDSDIPNVAGIRTDVVEALKAMLGIRADVHLVAPKSIERSEGKAKRVVDKRNLYQ